MIFYEMMLCVVIVRNVMMSYIFCILECIDFTVELRLYAATLEEDEHFGFDMTKKIIEKWMKYSLRILLLTFSLDVQGNSSFLLFSVLFSTQ